MPTLHRTAPLILALCAATACAPGEGERSAAIATTHTDSAGVDVVFNDVPLGGPRAFATLDPVPSLRLGSLDGAEEEQFGSIGDLAPLGDGGVAVLDQQAAQVRLFGPGGAYLGALGARGEGPGELMTPGSLARLHGDTFAVYDRRTRRITRYPADGGDADVRTLQGEGGSLPNVATFFPDGRLVGSIRWFAGEGVSLPNEGEDRVALDSAVIAVYSAQGDLVDTATVIPNRESIQKWMQVGQGINILISNTAFARSGVFAAHPDGVWAGFGDRWEFRLHDAADGTLRRIVRAPGLERPLTDAEAEAVHAAAAANDTTPAERERREVWWNLSPRPEVRPTFDRILVDDQARLWLREWPGADEGPQRWWVFGREGDLLGSVDAPAGVTLLAVSGGDAWGVLRDDLDVQYVVRHPLEVAGP